MLRRIRLMVLGVAVAAPLLAGAGEGEKKGPPFADGPKEAAAQAKPKTRLWNVKKDAFAYSFSFEPGVPDPDQVTEILVVVNEIPKTPHPRYGSAIPLTNARVVLEVSNPAGEVVGRFLAHPMPRSTGKYGVHLTPMQEGIYTVALKGRTRKGQDLAAEVKLPVKVWPLPDELKGSGDDVSGSGGQRAIIRKPLGTN